eukprot:7378976-Pyramimonas_sp.AAC.1
MSSNRTTSSFSTREDCWNAGPTCPSRAGDRRPGKAREPGVPVEDQCALNVRVFAPNVALRGFCNE